MKIRSEEFVLFIFCRARIAGSAVHFNIDKFLRSGANETCEYYCDGYLGCEAIYYVVYLQPSGFVIVSTDDLVEPIIAFAGTGTYDPAPGNPLGALVTKDLKGRIDAVRSTFVPLAIAPQAAVKV